MTGLDYLSSSQSDTFTTGDADQTLCVAMTTSEDSEEESTEYFIVRFSSIHSNEITTEVSIADNDG